MNKISNVCAITALHSISGFASAEPTWHASTINKVYPQSNGDVVLTFTQDHAKCTNDSIPKYYYLSAKKMA
ncbi:hypothetical protein J8L98_12815 [Pseudoalteromonas sp. MMG013]|uniref:hypothetical protein n=1 Tax=Pseudoalteromonas sp. MMG013 TaxID=2822687 RepID=UPI001B37A769|nr:hypothetical protein [Pseudoalteromonas sp. MMG013]MBQ4862570.1 hypothetical protein [Pseudoalteromonas sp. MMG013]